MTPLCFWQDGAIPSDENSTEKHNVNGVARTKDLSVKSLLQENPGLTHELDVEKLNLLETALDRADSEEIKLLLTEFKRRFKGGKVALKSFKEKKCPISDLSCQFLKTMSFLNAKITFVTC